MLTRISKPIFVGLIILLTSIKFVVASIEVKMPVETNLIKDTSKILCSFQTKSVYVYFENKTASSSSSQILQELNKCGTSYISIRNRFRSSAVRPILDDGILMYLLIILHDASEPIELSMLQKKSAAKHRSYILIIIEDSSAITFDWLRGAFKKCWQIWYPNVVILYWQNNLLQTYRYNPFAERFLIKMNFNAYIPTKEEDLFPTRLPNMQQKPLRVCLYHDDLRAIFRKNGEVGGSDGFMTSFIAQRLNATLIVNRVSTYGFENRTADLCFREISTGLDDISLNTRFLSLPSFELQVEPTIVHERDDLCALVPKAKIASIFWNLFRTYSSLVWLLILISLFLAYGFCNALKRFLCLKQAFLLQLFGSSLMLPFYRPPLKVSLRFFLACWFFYGMLICGAFTGNLTSNLVFRTYLPDIDTLEDFALSPYQLLMFPRHLKHLERFLNSSNKYEAMIKQKMTIVPDAVLMKNLETNNLSFAYLQKFHVARFRVNARLHLRHGRPQFHVMDTCIVPFHAVYIVPYGSPFLGYINFLIRSSHEFGFVRRWERMMHAYFLKSGRSFLRSKRTDDDPVVLKLDHFQAAFFFWAFGLLIAFLVFLWEKFEKTLACFRKRKQFKQQILRLRKQN